MQIIGILLLVLLSLAQAGLAALLRPISSRLARPFERSRIASLSWAHMLGTGIGGDDYVMGILTGIPNAAEVLEEKIALVRAKGRDSSVYEFTLGFLSAAQSK